MYLIHSRPDICYAVSFLNQLLRYLRGTIVDRLRLASSDEVKLLGYANSIQDGSIVTSTTEAKCIAVSTTKAKYISTSTTEAKYITTSSTCRETV